MGGNISRGVGTGCTGSPPQFVIRAAGPLRQGFLLIALAVWAVPAQPQIGTPAQTGAHFANGSSAEDYTVGAGDVLTVTVSDAPEWGGKYRVSGSGEIAVGGIAEPIQAEGKSPAELSRQIERALVEQKQFRNPRVNVFVDEFHGRTIDVLGSVAKPASYALMKRTTLLEALSLAGGALPGAGGTVTVVRGPASAEAAGAPVGSVQIIDMNRVVSGEDQVGNVVVRSGDVINVSAAQVVYVVGAVARPGGFTLTDPAAGMSVAQALAMAQGFRQSAASHHGLIIRQSTSKTARREVPVDVAQILTGKTTDVILAPNDILFIPDSTSKKALHAAGDVAMTMINGIAIYGVGLRVSGH